MDGWLARPVSKDASTMAAENSNSYLSLGIFILVAGGFPFIPLALAWLWHHRFQPGKPDNFPGKE